MARKKKTDTENFEVECEKEIPEVEHVPEPEDSNRKIKMEIIDQIEKINNRYYLLIVKKYIDNLGV